LDFPESSSEDEDYHPEHDTEASQTSDDELSELFSDATSDIKSPRPLVTPLSVARSDIQTPILERIEEECVDSGNVPILTTAETAMVQTQNTVFQVPELRHISTPKSRHDLIATRTRSRLPMEDVQVEELEALFQAPDFEPPSFAPEDLDDEEIIWHGK